MNFDFRICTCIPHIFFLFLGLAIKVFIITLIQICTYGYFLEYKIMTSSSHGEHSDNILGMFYDVQGKDIMDVALYLYITIDFLLLFPWSYNRSMKFITIDFLIMKHLILVD
jgi:hypothetical protein